MAFAHLTDAEIREMVFPLTQPAAIVRWFKKQGFTVKVRPNGMPLVSRAHFDAMMTVGEVPKEETQFDPATMVDSAALIARFQKRAAKGSKKVG